MHSSLPGDDISFLNSFEKLVTLNGSLQRPERRIESRIHKMHLLQIDFTFGSKEKFSFVCQTLNCISTPPPIHNNCSDRFEQPGNLYEALLLSSLRDPAFNILPTSNQILEMTCVPWKLPSHNIRNLIDVSKVYLF